MAGSAARAAEIARGSARSFHGHAGCSGSGDQGGWDGGLQLLSARDYGGERCPVDDYDGGRNKMAAVQREYQVLLGLGEGGCIGG